MKKGKEQEEAKQTTLANLKLVEEMLDGKMFFGGVNFGFLDLAFGWLACYLGPLEVVTSLKLLDEDLFPKLCIWRKKFLDISAITESWPDQETLIVMFKEIKQSQGI